MMCHAVAIGRRGCFVRMLLQGVQSYYGSCDGFAMALAWGSGIAHTSFARAVEDPCGSCMLRTGKRKRGEHAMRCDMCAGPMSRAGRGGLDRIRSSQYGFE